MPSHLNFITGNANKLREVKFVLDPAGIEVRSQSIDIEEVQGTVEEVTKSKCKKAAETVNGPVLVEDTALCYKALGDLPGPYIKWFMTAVGHDGLNNLLAAYEDKSAEAVCTFGYCEGPGQEPILFQGRCQGKIVPARGPADFGWDAVFEHNGKTFAEMEKAEKSAISHRGMALKKLQEWFNEENATLN
ncbi:inosine triphosphate pyrophosphatase-like protein [Emericellopsis atlantica]|uniref:Inosine triphosphate pyrophosphatase n=1 Tax=Emericellopsis atlantica TaxID=2614577 RepID=A0A9P7ZV51_9HYPO|nr:inosine triphosphate pyrophosphatase-like protein [Emericellopsis atlantica]KAG9258332.1 inosine triphosphate pyrophosphatase-like protein [Emericellopsis atlantica]